MCELFLISSLIGAFKMVSNVLYDHRQELITCCYMTFILIVSCSFLVYLAEKSDEDSSRYVVGLSK